MTVSEILLSVLTASLVLICSSRIIEGVQEMVIAVASVCLTLTKFLLAAFAAPFIWGYITAEKISKIIRERKRLGIN